MASHLGKEIELIKLATELPNARYSSSGNPSVIIEMENDSKKAAGVLFGNGKILVTGISGYIGGNVFSELVKNKSYKVTFLLPNCPSTVYNNI